MKYRICVMTGTRAEYGLLRSLLFKLDADADIDLSILVTGTHLSKKFGNTQTEIAEDGFSYDSVLIPVESDSKAGMARNTGSAIIAFADYFEKHVFDMLVLLGDRYEAYAAASAAYIEGIAIAHISGGDVTEGALDDGFRHCITKMSTLHFPGCADSVRRVIQMGEFPDRVFDVGDPGVENCLNMDFWSVEHLSDNLEFDINGFDYGVVTFHPVTQEEGTAVIQLQELIDALDEFKEMKFIITTANADAGGRSINDLWMKASKLHDNWLVVPSLGVIRYLSAVKHSAVVIGNSSSGIVEAPALGVPTVNIGDRQKGRMAASSVINCLPKKDDISKAIATAVSKDFRAMASTCVSPFGKGNTSSDIVRIIKNYLSNGLHAAKKGFFDLNL